MIQELNTGDTLVVTRFIIVANDIQELLHLFKQLTQKGIWFTAIEQEYSTKISHPLSYTLQLIEQFLEDIRKQNQIMGIIKAKAHGIHIGRPRKLNENRILKALSLKELGYTSKDVANRLNVSKSTLLRNIAEFREAG